jgi:hypothetical protein
LKPVCGCAPSGTARKGGNIMSFGRKITRKKTAREHARSAAMQRLATNPEAPAARVRERVCAAGCDSHGMRVCARARACGCACVCACVRACVRRGGVRIVRVCVRVRVGSGLARRLRGCCSQPRSHGSHVRRDGRQRAGPALG